MNIGPDALLAWRDELYLRGGLSMCDLVRFDKILGITDTYARNDWLMEVGMSVNEAADNWRSLEWADGSECVEAMQSHEFGEGLIAAAGDLDRLARTAWKTVSEPPTEADGDRKGDVLVDMGDMVATTPWDNPMLQYEKAWARIRDVLLLPAEGEGE